MGPHVSGTTARAVTAPDLRRRTKYIRLATQNITDNTEAEWFEFVLKELEGRRFDSSSSVQWLGTFSCRWPNNNLSKKFPIGSIFPAMAQRPF